jgi:membrane protease YdiL (CAAX protease family)
LFQLVGAVIWVGMLAAQGVLITSLESAQTMILEHLDELFVGNSSGQLLVLGAGTWMIAKAGSGNALRSELRLGAPDSPVYYGLAVAAIVVVQPLVMLLGWLNLQIPFPQSYLESDRVQAELLEQFLRGDHFIPLTLFHVALIPAFCEEFLMRGFALRYFERSAGIVWAIVISSLIFGAFHIRFTQVLPLAALGMILAYVTYKSGSIYPAVLGHLLNNGANVILARVAPDFVFEEFTPEAMPPVWLIALSLVLSGAVVYLIHKNQRNHVLPTE